MFDFAVDNSLIQLEADRAHNLKSSKEVQSVYSVAVKGKQLDCQSNYLVKRSNQYTTYLSK